MSLPANAITKAGCHHVNATQSQVVTLVWTLCKQPQRVIIIYENTMRCLNITGSSTLSLDSAYVLVLQILVVGQMRDVLWRNQMITRSSVFAIISPTSPFLCKLVKIRFVVNTYMKSWVWTSTLLLPVRKCGFQNFTPFLLRWSSRILGSLCYSESNPRDPSCSY